MTRDAQPAPPAAPSAHRRNASLMRRYAAVAYESLLLAAIVLVVGFLTAPLVSPVDRSMRTFDIPPLPLRALSACAVFGTAGFYFVWSWTGGRRTLPMKTWRLTLERTDGRSVDAMTAVTRYLAAWIGPLAGIVAYEGLKPATFGTQALWLLPINYLWPLVDPDRQFLHDRIAGTRIVLAATPDRLRR